MRGEIWGRGEERGGMGKKRSGVCGSVGRTGRGGMAGAVAKEGGGGEGVKKEGERRGGGGCFIIWRKRKSVNESSQMASPIGL